MLFKIGRKLRKFTQHLGPDVRSMGTMPDLRIQEQFELEQKRFNKDEFTNITPKIVHLMDRKLHNTEQHPLCLVKRRIIDYFYKSFTNSRGNPIFSVHDNLSPIVSIEQNFDSLLIPDGHPSRAKSDCYYINKEYLMRAHTTCHQSELIRSGLDAFLIIGDVYRRDEIDRTHFPIFHQIDGVQLFTRSEVFRNKNEHLQLFETGNNSDQGKQECHTLEAMKVLEHSLKSTLVGLAQFLFGADVSYRWTVTQFPFTTPSWELEVQHEGQWLELLGCGLIKQPILTTAGVIDRVGWAFGIGIDRIAMKLYHIPDIRLFWSTDSGFLSQFAKAQPHDNVIYQAISQYPPCSNDISFWLPTDSEFNSNDFYDLVRSIGGDIIEQVALIDRFQHPKSKKISHCYRIVYRHMERTLTQDEVNVIHANIEQTATRDLHITIR